MAKAHSRMPVVFFGHGSPMNMLEPVDVQLDESWGLDHGTWSVLKHAYPDAKIPVVQLSIDGTKPPAFHYEIGKRPAPLRDEGVLVAGSGNVVHNLRLMKRAGGAPFDWAVRFNERIREALASRDHRVRVDVAQLGEDSRLSVPTPEHYLPLLYVAALQGEDEPMSFVVDGYDLGSVSMLTAFVGMPAR